MQMILKAVDSFSGKLGNIISYLNIAIVGIVVWEMVARRLFNAPTIWASEGLVMLTGFLYALTGGYAQLHKRHVRVDILYDRLGPKGKIICDGLTYIFFCSFMFTLIWTGVDFALDSIRFRETTGTPWNPIVYPLKCAVPVGAFLTWIQMTADIVRRFLFYYLHSSCLQGREA